MLIHTHSHPPPPPWASLQSEQQNGGGADGTASGIDRSSSHGKRTRGFPRVIKAGHGIKLGAVVSALTYTSIQLGCIPRSPPPYIHVQCIYLLPSFHTSLALPYFLQSIPPSDEELEAAVLCPHRGISGLLQDHRGGGANSLHLCR